MLFSFYLVSIKLKLFRSPRSVLVDRKSYWVNHKPDAKILDGRKRIFNKKECATGIILI